MGSWETLRTLGHEPAGDGDVCLHRWRNRTTRAVHCRFLAGWRAALAASESSAPAGVDAVKDGRFEGRFPPGQLLRASESSAPDDGLDRRLTLVELFDGIDATYGRAAPPPDAYVLIRDVYAAFGAGTLYARLTAAAHADREADRDGE